MSPIEHLWDIIERISGFFLVVGLILVVPGMSQNGGGGGERNDMLGMVTDAMMNIAIGLIEGCRDMLDNAEKVVQGALGGSR
ncbi:hypothetical protein CDAR_523751 [Caerostris darwini]|uniref:Uncharacterized protein n=1 Tax=Caerostris darwini TaxID=1538125 RepID=A0AAV4TTL6_9ARAC|nr:hypothetical protein CDAR_523751 [Caerostris darwini]